VAKIRPKLPTSQYAGSVLSDHSQGQALVESLSLPMITGQRRFFARPIKKEAKGLPYTPMVSIATG